MSKGFRGSGLFLSSTLAFSRSLFVFQCCIIFPRSLLKKWKVYILNFRGYFETTFLVVEIFSCFPFSNLIIEGKGKDKAKVLWSNHGGKDKHLPHLSAGSWMGLLNVRGKLWKVTMRICRWCWGSKWYVIKVDFPA